MSSAPEPLSVVVVARDAERDVARCLRSVRGLADVLVADTGSHDATAAVAEREGARVVRLSWDGWVETRNRAITQARHRFVLSLDADEWLTPKLRREIEREMAAPRADAYRIDRRTAFCGAFLRRTWTPDRPVRLFRRDIGRFEGGRVHESVRLVPGARVARLRGAIEHLSYRSLEDYLARLDRYTTLAAGSLDDRGARFSLARLVLSPPATFLRLYVLRGGFADGVRGFVASAGSAFYVLAKHAKHWERHRSVDPALRAEAGPTPEDPDPAARPAERQFG